MFVLLSLVIVAAYLYAPLAKGLGEFTRVMYFHVPAAWVTVVAFFIGAFYSVLYLRKRNIMFDLYAEAASQLGVIFCLLATVTGALWAKESWGAYWNWDPRQTSIFILLLIYGAYFSLRSAVEQEETRARLSAVYSILAFVTVPFFVFIIPRIYESLHPDPLINQEAKMKMNGQMLTVFLSSLGGFTMLFFWMMHLKKSLIQISRNFEKLVNQEN
ncbi:MAG: cytochrome C biogenesis protein [Calditrichaeota bacterium]|nr:MAG: cytochrome C biogenesis protein [Calditrichota bacterium]MBL1206916.1 cytochrome C biogenesis protein [Calditrichota bacterium]NOG46743.1 cytochrome c biogenesis protein CcsA [Calditrichota bacterium]